MLSLKRAKASRGRARDGIAPAHSTRSHSSYNGQWPLIGWGLDILVIKYI